MAFRFPLATVLRFRQSIERREERALQQVLLEIAQARRKIEQLTRDLTNAERAREAALLNTISSFELQSMLTEAKVLTDRRRTLIESLGPLEERRIKQMNAYKAAHRDRQILSDMAIREREAWEVARDRAQQKQLDDIFAARAHRS
jgi:flagellar FliJ protein